MPLNVRWFAKRPHTFARLLQLAAFLAWAVPSHAQSLTLTSLNKSTVQAFESLTLIGQGFDPTAAISVVIVPRGGETTIVPVYEATSSSLKIVVPPILDPDFIFNSPVLGRRPAVADVRAIQISVTTVTTSNTLGGLIVDLPPMPTAPLGATIDGWLLFHEELQNMVRNRLAANAAINPKIVEHSLELERNLAEVRRAAATVANDRFRVAEIPSVAGQLWNLSQADLSLMDRLVFSLIRQLSVQLGPPPTSISACAVRTTDLQTDQALCSLLSHFGSAATAPAASSQVAASLAYGTAVSLIATQATGGLTLIGLRAPSVAKASQLAVAPLMGALVSWVDAGETVQLGRVFRRLGPSLTDAVTSFGSSVPMTWQLGLQLGTDAEASRPAAASIPPGIVVRGPRIQIDSNGLLTALAITDSIVGIDTRSLYFSEQQGAIGIKSSTRLPTGPSLFNGDFVGDIGGGCSNPNPNSWTIVLGRTAVSLNAGVAYSPTGAVGTVSEFGHFTADLPLIADGTCRFEGRFSIDGAAKAYGTGDFSCVSPRGVCRGPWNVNRR